MYQDSLVCDTLNLSIRSCSSIPGQRHCNVHVLCSLSPHLGTLEMYTVDLNGTNKIVQIKPWFLKTAISPFYSKILSLKNVHIGCKKMVFATLSSRIGHMNLCLSSTISVCPKFVHLSCFCPSTGWILEAGTDETSLYSLLVCLFVCLFVCLCSVCPFVVSLSVHWLITTCLDW